MIDQGLEVVGEPLRPRPARHLAGEPEAPVIESDAREPVLEVRDLLPPREVVTPEAVGEDQGRALSVGLVVEVASGTREKRHRAPPIWAEEW